MYKQCFVYHQDLFFYTSKVDSDIQELQPILYLIFTVKVFHNPVLTLPLSISQFTTNENFFQRKLIAFLIMFAILVFGYMGLILRFSFLVAFT